MTPTLQYLLLSRDVITDDVSKEVTPVRVFDTIFMGKDETSTVYSFHAVGRLNLNETGIVTSMINLKLIDPTGKEVRTVTLSGSSIDASIGINVNGIFFLVPFSTEGRYSIELSVNMNGGTFVQVTPPLYFWVKKLTA